MRVPWVSRAAADRLYAALETQQHLHEAVLAEVRRALDVERERTAVLQVDLRQLGERLANRERDVTRETPAASTLPYVLAETIEAITRGNADWRRLLTRKAWALWDGESRSTDPGTLAAMASAIRYDEPMRR